MNELSARKKKSLLSKEQKDKILEYLADGRRIKDLPDLALCSEKALQWERTHDLDFQAAFTHARATYLETLEDNLLRMAEDEPDVYKARLKSDNIKWVLSKRIPQVYGDRIDVTVNQTIDISQALSDARKRALLPDCYLDNTIDAEYSINSDTCEDSTLGYKPDVADNATNQDDNPIPPIDKK
mgnify:CR=1 FL=1